MITNAFKGIRPRVLLLAAAAMGFAVGAHAQTTGYPVDGIYVGLAGGFNLKGGQSVKGASGNLGLGGVSTPNGTLHTGIAGAAVGSVGWGFGNGVRLEVEGDWRNNGFNSASGVNPVNGFGASRGASGSVQLFGPMVNAYYDFVGVSPWVVPYVGLGLGAQWARLHNFAINGTGSPGLGNPELLASGSVPAFSAQGILGVAFPIPGVPGLAATAEYRILGVTNNRGYNATLVATNAAGARVSSPHGSFTLGREYNNTFVFGLRYALWTPPPPPPAPVPVAAPAPAPSRSYLVFFDWDKYSLTERARQIIRDAAQNSTRVQYTRIEVNGYTDTSGTPKYNKGLSIRRANAVANELVADGVPRNVITAQGFGDTNLLVPTGPNVREPQNRRVEIILR